ncbi:MAG: SIMPL domain-containing protein [Propionibacteriaceae bacterium]|nr:SIMPL domain-containing protein [Propionibacteriaceae bacterium]
MGVLSVTIDDDIRIDAVRARIHAVFAGTNRLLGGAAGKQAAEVRQLVSALAAVGLGEDAVEVEGVRIETGSGALKLGQSALVQVVVTSPNERIADVLGLLSSQNGVTVERIEWVYDGFEASLPATADAMVKARRKADAIAAAAGLVVTGVKQVSDSWRMPLREVAFAAPMAFGARASAADSMDFGVEVSSSTTLGVHLTVEFEIGERDSSPSATES